MNGLTLQGLDNHNHRFLGTGGRSQENRSSGFIPAFQNTRNGDVYLSRFANGRLAPIHVLDGLPETVVLARTPSHQVTEVR